MVDERDDTEYLGMRLNGDAHAISDAHGPGLRGQQAQQSVTRPGLRLWIAERSPWPGPCAKVAESVFDAGCVPRDSVKCFDDAFLARSSGHRGLQQFVYMGPSLQSLHRGGQILVGLLELASPSNVVPMYLRTCQRGTGPLCEHFQQQDVI